MRPEAAAAQPDSNMTPSLEDVLSSKLNDLSPDVVEPFFSELQKKIGDRCDAILAYGSCLSSVTKSGTSTPDFYVIVNQYRRFHRSTLHAVLNFFLPPSIYHFAVGKEVSKFNVIAWRDIQHETSTCARDVYHLGRFSKRMGLVWARDNDSRRRVAEIQAQAMRTVARKVYPLLPPAFDLDGLIREALRISYTGEVRVEADDKIDRLLQAERDHYHQTYRLVLAELTGPPWYLGQNPKTGMYQKTPSFFRDFWRGLSVHWLLRRSRFRAQLRWPKGMVTVENWVDYVIAKIERTKGIQIQMTPRQKKLWFIYGWKHFYALRKRNLIR